MARQKSTRNVAERPTSWKEPERHRLIIDKQLTDLRTRNPKATRSDAIGFLVIKGDKAAWDAHVADLESKAATDAALIQELQSELQELRGKLRVAQKLEERKREAEAARIRTIFLESPQRSRLLAQVRELAELEASGRRAESKFPLFTDAKELLSDGTWKSLLAVLEGGRV